MLEEFETRSDAQAVGHFAADTHNAKADRQSSATAGNPPESEMTPQKREGGSEITATAGDRFSRLQKPTPTQVDPEIPAQAGGMFRHDEQPMRPNAHPSNPPQGGEPSRYNLKPGYQEAAPANPEKSGVNSSRCEKPKHALDSPLFGSDADRANLGSIENRPKREGADHFAGNGDPTIHGITDDQRPPGGGEISGNAGGDANQSVLDSRMRQESITHKSSRKAGKIDDDRAPPETQVPSEVVDLRFSDPLIAQIREAHRMRRRWMKARNALILQGKAIARSYVEGGDKKAATDMYNRVVAGKLKPGDEGLVLPLMPFLPAIEGFDAQLKVIEKRLEKLAAQLPVAEWVRGVRGFGIGSLAAIVGEAGDLSKYPTVAGVWKRMGLAVINGERQRKCADADKAVIHGYSPDRRSIVWNMAESVAKLQRTWADKETGEIKKPADPYGEFLEAEKARILEAGERPIVAEQRAKRHMSKRILRDLTVEWRRIAQGRVDDQKSEETQCLPDLDAPEFREAAE